MDSNFLILALVVVPVLSVCLGFTVHFAIQPMVQTLVDAIEDLSRMMARPEPNAEVSLLQAEVSELRGELRALQASSDFDRELLGVPRSPTDAPTGSL